MPSMPLFSTVRIGFTYYSLIANNLNQQPDLSPAAWVQGADQVHFSLDGGNTYGPPWQWCRP